MKKKELGKMALLGMASGFMALCSGTVQADAASYDAQHILAGKCKASGGCGGLTASRDAPATNDDDADDLSDDSADSDEAPTGVKPAAPVKGATASTSQPK